MKTPSFCRLNLNALLHIIILSGYAMLFFWMLLSGRMQSFLHPRMFPPVLFAAAAFVLMAFALRRGLRMPQRRFAVGSALFFCVPLLMACVIPAGAVSSSSLTFSKNKLIGLSSATAKASVSPAGAASFAASSSAVRLKSNQTLVTLTSPFGSKVQEILTDNTIDLNDNNMVLWINELNTNPQKYIGKKIRYTGYVYKSGEGFTADEFLPGRDMMWCCAADIQVIGVLCRYQNASTLKENSWVKISGTLSATTYQGQSVPVIRNPTVTPAAKDKEQYVYAAY